MGVRVGNITVDCDDVMRVALFWSDALERPLDDGASEWVSSIGSKDADRVEPVGGETWFVALSPRSASRRQAWARFLGSPPSFGVPAHAADEAGGAPSTPRSGGSPSHRLA